ncbi:hypothetical protein MHYP_G00250770 [Metynnis hypsauchen]
MPECRRHRPGIGSSGEGSEGNDNVATRRTKTLLGFKDLAPSRCESENALSHSKNSETGRTHETDTSVQSAVTEKDINQSSRSSAGQGSGHSQSTPVADQIPSDDYGNNSNKICMKDEETAALPTSFFSVPSSANGLQEGPKKPDFPMIACKEDCTDITPKEEVAMKLMQNSVTELTRIKDRIDAVGDSVAEAFSVNNHGQINGCVEGTTLAKGISEEASPAPLLGEEHCDVEGQSHEEKIALSNADVTNEVTQSGVVIPDVSFDTNIPNPDIQSNCIANNSQNSDQVVTVGEFLQAQNLNASSDLESSPCLPESSTSADKRVSKLDTILEVSFPESGEDIIGQEMAEVSDCSTTLMASKDMDNSPLQKEVLQKCSSGTIAEQELLGNCQNSEVTELPLVSVTSLESNMGVPQSAGPSMSHQASPNLDGKDGLERPQEPPVKLRTRKLEDRKLSSKRKALSRTLKMPVVCITYGCPN